jgi:hypothetical protein
MMASGLPEAGQERALPEVRAPQVELQGTYDQVADAIPRFIRRPFALYTEASAICGGAPYVGENPLLDEVVQLDSGGSAAVPVGIVSKAYKLIQHQSIFEAAVKALDQSQVDMGKVAVMLTLSQFGTQMALRFVLPAEFGFNPGDGHPIHLRLECFNSVDGSTRLHFLMSWFRLICSNGMVARVAGSHRSTIHSERADVPDLKALILDGIVSIDGESKSYGRALATPVDASRLRAWVDTELRAAWGPLAAARAYLICRTGYDGVFLQPFDTSLPSEKLMKKTELVPGSPAGADNLYAITQALAWIARKRFSPQEQAQYMLRIPGLIDRLVASNSSSRN